MEAGFDSILAKDFEALKTAWSGLAAISEEAYREMSELEKWPEDVRPELEEFAQLALPALDNRSRIASAFRNAQSYEQAMSDAAALGSQSTVDNTERQLELATSIRVKLGLSLDREASCAVY